MNAYVPVGQRRYSPAPRKATDVAPSVNPTPDVIPASSNHLWAPTVMLRRKAAATRRGRAVSQSRRHVWRDLWIVRGMTCSFSPPWALCQPIQPGPHHLHGDARCRGRRCRRRGRRSARRPRPCARQDRRPAMAGCVNTTCLVRPHWADGKCKRLREHEVRRHRRPATSPQMPCGTGLVKCPQGINFLRT